MKFHEQAKYTDNSFYYSKKSEETKYVEEKSALICQTIKEKQQVKFSFM